MLPNTDVWGATFSDSHDRLVGISVSGVTLIYPIYRFACLANL